MNNYETEQEEFWAGSFGDDYIERNQGRDLLAQNLKFFTAALRQSENIKSCLELGANVGMNLKALHLLFPGIALSAVEINTAAAKILRETIGEESVFEGSIFDFSSSRKHDLVLIKTVLIHINPEMLDSVYEKLYESSKKYILICEYYNPTPVTVNYRGEDDRLFKRDFAGDMLDKYSDLTLVDYGFAYGRPPSLLDDITWFLLAKL